MARQFCTFYVGGHCFGIEVHAVQEVLRHQEMTRVPLSPPEVEGLINLRGQIVMAIDLRRRLGLDPRPENVRPMNIIVHTPEGATSFLVDEIGEVIPVEDEAFEPAPPTLTGTPGELVEGVYKLDGELMLVLDTHKTVDLKAA